MFPIPALRRGRRDAHDGLDRFGRARPEGRQNAVLDVRDRRKRPEAYRRPPLQGPLPALPRGQRRRRDARLRVLQLRGAAAAPAATRRTAPLHGGRAGLLRGCRARRLSGRRAQVSPCEALAWRGSSPHGGGADVHPEPSVADGGPHGSGVAGCRRRLRRGHGDPPPGRLRRRNGGRHRARRAHHRGHHVPAVRTDDATRVRPRPRGGGPVRASAGWDPGHSPPFARLVGPGLRSRIGCHRRGVPRQGRLAR
jgi:hypothetical protein